MVDLVHAAKPGGLLTFCGVFQRKLGSTRRLTLVTCLKCLNHEEVKAGLVEEKLTQKHVRGDQVSWYYPKDTKFTIGGVPLDVDADWAAKYAPTGATTITLAKVK